MPEGLSGEAQTRFSRGAGLGQRRALVVGRGGVRDPFERPGRRPSGRSEPRVLPALAGRLRRGRACSEALRIDPRRHDGGRRRRGPLPAGRPCRRRGSMVEQVQLTWPVRDRNRLVEVLTADPTIYAEEAAPDRPRGPRLPRGRTVRAARPARVDQPDAGSEVLGHAADRGAPLPRARLGRDGGIRRRPARTALRPVRHPGRFERPPRAPEDEGRQQGPESLAGFGLGLAPPRGRARRGCKAARS